MDGRIHVLTVLNYTNRTSQKDNLLSSTFRGHFQVTRLSAIEKKIRQNTDFL